MKIIEDAPLKAPDTEGVWAEDERWVAYPQSLYLTRNDARRKYMEMTDLHFTEVRVLVRWMRYTPKEWPGLDHTTYIEDYWTLCESADPDAFRVWLCE